MPTLIDSLGSFVHSQYDPLSEGKRLVAELSGKKVCLLWGLGYGYSLDAIAQLSDPPSHIYIWEPPNGSLSLLQIKKKS